MKNAIAVVALTFVLIAGFGCSSITGGGAPSGAFPAKVGSFKLDRGPDADNGKPPHYVAKYRASTGKEVQLDVTVYESEDAAKKEDASRVSTDDIFRYAEGSKKISVNKAGRSSISWLNKAWLYEASSDDQAQTNEFVDAMPK